MRNAATCDVDEREPNRVEDSRCDRTWTTWIPPPTFESHSCSREERKRRWCVARSTSLPSSVKSHMYVCVYTYMHARSKVTNWEKEQLRRAVLSRVIAWQWCIVRDVRSVLSSYIIVTNIYSRNMFTVRWTLTKQSQTSDRPVCARAAKKKTDSIGRFLPSAVSSCLVIRGEIVQPCTPMVTKWMAAGCCTFTWRICRSRGLYVWRESCTSVVLCYASWKISVSFFNFFSIFLLPTCHSSLISLFLSPFNHSGIFALMWNAIWLHLSTFVENIFRHISDTEFEII